MLPTLDAHAHLDVSEHPEPFSDCGVVLAQTMSLADAEASRVRRDGDVAFGVGCHPRIRPAVTDFDVARLTDLIERAAVVGEVGLDRGSRAPWEEQLATFRAILGVVAGSPRIVSIHSHGSTGAVLDELRRASIVAPILHRWAGSAPETSEAVQLGCYFSVHASVARRSTWRGHVPLDRILLESDHGLDDPPAAIPLRIGWVEHLVAQQYDVTPEAVRAASWRNLARIVELTATRPLLPAGIQRNLDLAQAAASA